MKTVFLFVLTIYSFSSIQAKLYQTINDGYFFDSSVWDRKEVPKLLKGDSIIIRNHLIVYNNEDTFGAKQYIYIKISNTGTLCLGKMYVVKYLKMDIEGLLYSKSAYFEYDSFLITGCYISNEPIVIRYGGQFHFYHSCTGIRDTAINCPALKMDTLEYTDKCPKLGFGYHDTIINDTISLITFWNSQNTIMKVKIKDSTYSILSGNFIKIKHKPIEDVIVSIQAVDNCDRLKEHAFKLIYDGKIQTSSLTEIKENSDFLVYSISNNIWKISAGKPDLYTYRIYDLSGKNIVKGKFKQNTEINLENQAQGIYFIQIENNQSIVFSQKIALED